MASTRRVGLSSRRVTVWLAAAVGLSFWNAPAAAAGPAAQPADPLARAQALDLAARGHDEPGLHVLRQIESEYVKALKRDPGAAEPSARLRGFYDAWAFQVPTPAASLRELIAAAPDPELLALRLTRSEPDSINNVSGEIVLSALDACPRSARLWARAARLAVAPAWKLALLAEAGRNAAAAPGVGAGALAEAAAIASSRLAELSDLGLAAEMLRAFAALPEPLRETLARGGAVVRPAVEPPPEEPLDPPYSPWLGRDLRLDLAAAHLLTGDVEGGREWAARAGVVPTGAGVPPELSALAVGRAAQASLMAEDPLQESLPEGWRDPEDAAVGRQEQRWRLVVERWLAPVVGEDLFPLLSGWVVESGPIVPQVWAMLVSRLARRQGYPAVAAHLLVLPSLIVARRLEDAAIASPSGSVPDPWATASAVPPRVRQEATRLAAALSGLASELDGELATPRDATRAAGLAPSGGAVHQLAGDSPHARAALALVLEEIAGTAPAARLELFELDRASHAAIAVWDAEGQGGTIVLEEKDGNFEVVIHLLTIT
jgi:hypothetical protein